MPGNMAPSRSTGRSAGWRPGVHRPWLTRLIAFFATKNVTVPYLPQSSRGVAFGGARSYHLCGLGGLVLGLITGLLGARAIALTTEAVESVVIHHLVHQLAALKCEDPEAATVIGGIVADEREHHDRSAEKLSEHRLFDRLLRPIVRGATESVIWLGMRL